jgi:pyruvate formate lyase activating enzyme
MKQSNIKASIDSIETFGLVDGPGIRTVVFFNGCMLRCKYCHNPDTWEPNKGDEMTVEEVLKSFYHNTAFYKTGGVTVTGGEPMMQLDFLIELFTELHEGGYHTCIDTSGIMFQPENEKVMSKIEKLMDLTDLVMLDIKHIDDEKHKELTSHSNARILDFARYLDKKGIPIWIRHVIVPGITLYKEYLERLGEFMATLGNVKALDVLPYHSMGKVKYESLGMEYPLAETREATKQEAVAAKNIILGAYKKAKKDN